MVQMIIFLSFMNCSIYLIDSYDKLQLYNLPDVKAGSTLCVDACNCLNLVTRHHIELDVKF